MNPQKSYHKNARVLAANGNLMNFEYSASHLGTKPVIERSPKRRESFKIMKSKRIDGIDVCPTQSEVSDRNVAIMSSPVTNKKLAGTTGTKIPGYNPRTYVPADNSMAHYTLMSFSNSNNPLNSTSIYANPNVSALNSQEYAEQDVNNIFDDFESFSFQTFPPYFNPRTASNMPHQEKVNKWIENVPTFNVSGDVWESECYSVDLDLDWEEKEFDCGISNRSDVPSFSLATADEVLHLQAKRLDTLVRRNYELTVEVPLTPRRL